MVRGEMLIEPDKPFHAASTMKIPVMIELFRQVAAGQVSLDGSADHPQRIPQHRRRQSYALSVEDDSDREVYAAVGRTMTLRQLCELMITVSSNFATNLLIERLGVEKIRATVTRLGADGMQVLRGRRRRTRRSRRD